MFNRSTDWRSSTRKRRSLAVAKVLKSAGIARNSRRISSGLTAVTSVYLRANHCAPNESVLHYLVYSGYFKYYIHRLSPCRLFGCMFRAQYCHNVT